jgi:hypothetical protein
MAKYSEIVSMVLDMLKETTDDATYTEGHIIFLAGRYRSFLLKQRYAQDLKKQIPESNYQTLCLDLEKIEAVEGLPCEGDYYLRTTKEIPTLLPCGNTRVFTSGSYYKGDISFISKDRFKYIGYNKWLQNIIYACLDPNGKIYLTSKNPQFLYLENLQLHGIFENAEEASELECSKDGKPIECDILDRNFPLEDALITPLIELIVKELSPSIQAPEDKINNAEDDLSQNVNGVSRVSQ